LVYAPKQVTIDSGESQVGSLALRHQDEEGIILRYKMLIKRAGGDFVQWGTEKNECLPYCDDAFMLQFMTTTNAM